MIKISELTPKGANLQNSDLLEVSVTTADGYESKSITGAEIITAAQSGLQPTLVSGTNIKTINGNSLLGSGDLTISGSNIYNADGTLTGARTLTLGGVALTIAGTTSSRFQANGNVGIGTTTDAGFKLDVNGTARVQGNTNIIGFLSATNYLECRGTIFLRTSVGGGNTSFNTDASTMYIAQSSSVNLQIGYGGNYSFLLNNANRTIGIADNGSSPTLATSAVLTLSSTTKGFLPPRMTTSQKTAIASPTAGLVVFDTTLNKLCVYTTTWETITSI